jgi:hypothetical protein
MADLTSKAVLVSAFVGLLTATIGAAHAQAYPSGPVKLIVPVPAGSVTDTMALARVLPHQQLRARRSHPHAIFAAHQDDLKHWGAL